jgi:hypothetical protein
MPPWGEHIHPPADPLTDFQAGSWPLLQRIPKVGNALNVMWVFGSNLMMLTGKSKFEAVCPSVICV